MRVNLKTTGRRLSDPVTGNEVELFNAHGKPLDLSDVICVEVQPLRPGELATVKVTYALTALGGVPADDGA